MSSIKSFLNILKIRHKIYLAAFIIGILAICFAISQTKRVKRLVRYHLGIEEFSDLTAIRIALAPKGRDVYFQGDGLKLAGTLFNAEQRLLPGIIFLHGSSVHGRRLGFYLVLCDWLSKNGFHVLSMDMRGFGDSEDPMIIDSADAWTTRGDISEALDYFIANESVDTSAIYIVGHSAGANQAIIAGIGDSRFKKVVAIGPSRRTKERLLNHLSNERRYFIERFSKVRELDELLSWETYRQIASNSMIDSYIPYFQSDNHKPILLIDGSREDDADQRFLQLIYDLMKPPKAYITIAGSNHYSNTKDMGPFILYHKQIVNELVQSIVGWLRN